VAARPDTRTDTGLAPGWVTARGDPARLLRGLHASGRTEEEAARRLCPAERDACRELVGAGEHLRAAGRSPKEAVARVLREAAVTTLNRRVAIRVAE
jgi:hypothetical protein